MVTPKRKLLTVPIVIVLLGVLSAVHSNEHPVVTKMVQWGLKNNIEISQEKSKVRQAEYDRKSVISNFFPRASLQTRYTHSRGGRELAVGDLMNPVYSNLNMLNGSNAPQYPMIENTPLMPEHDFETRLRIEQPLFNYDILLGKKLKTVQLDNSKAQLQQKQYHLVKEIRNLYFLWLQSEEAVKVYTAGKERAEEYKRLMEKLLKGGVVTKAAVLEAEVGLIKSQQKIEEARKNNVHTVHYVNSILQKKLTESLEYVSSEQLHNTYGFVKKYEQMSSNELFSLAQKNRVEFTIVDNFDKIVHLDVTHEKAAFFPTAGAQIDAGFNGDTPAINRDNGKFSASVVVNWDLFTGGKRNYNKKKAEERIKYIQDEKEKLNTMVRYMIGKTHRDLTFARGELVSAEKQHEAALGYFNEVKKRYKQGMDSYTKFTEANTYLTEAKMNLSLKKISILTAISEFITALGLNKIPSMKG